MTSTSSATFTYDSNGNTLTKADSSGTASYTWDFENRLTQVQPPGGTLVTFQYDPFGRRIEKSSSAGTVIFVCDGANIVEELNAAGNATAQYAQGAGINEPLAANLGGTLAFYEADGLGSVTSMTNNSGSAVAAYIRDAFGNPTSTADTLGNRFRYTGREWDDETGLYYYRARYYDSSAGRFISEDPLRYGADNGSFYRSVKNQPTFFRDPSGLLSIGPGFSPQCLADLLNAIQMLKNRPPACDCWFRTHGPHIPLFVLLDNPLYRVSYDPKGNSAPGEHNTLAYINPGDPFHIFMTPNGCNSGPTHIAQDLVHELGHLMLGHYLPWYQRLKPEQENREHNKVRLLEGTCGFAIQTQGTSVTVTAQ